MPQPQTAAADAYASDITQLLRDAAQKMGVKLRDDLVGMQQNLSASMQRLARTVGQAGAEEAQIAERNTIALQAAQALIGEGDAADERLIAIIDTGLAIGSRALSLALGVPPVAPA